jgi:predicted esterase
MKHTSIFIHGLLGSSRGTKATFFRERYPHMLIGDFRGTLAQRMEQLDRLLVGEQSLILVGSSFGGVMAAIYGLNHEEKVKRIILLAPALSFHEFEPYLDRTTNIPVIIFHGTGDRVVPIDPVWENAATVFKDLVFNRVDDDHVLSNTFASMDWDSLLEG